MAVPQSVLSGELLPSQFVEQTLHHRFAGRLGEHTREVAARRFERWWRRCESCVGPATGVRTLIETCARPMFELLGFHLTTLAVDGIRGRGFGRAVTRQRHPVPVLIARWADDLERCWRDAVRESITAGASWTLCWNARQLRIVDAARPWGRRDIAFDLSRCATDPAAFAVLWGVARAEALESRRLPPSTGSSQRPRRHIPRGRASSFGGGVPDERLTLLDEIVAAASEETAAVCVGLEDGVTEALVLLADALATSAWRRHEPEAPFAEVLLDQSLTVIYRLLFLLFAEARLLVPMWHRTYRESYSIEALREAIEQEPMVPGLWSALQAITRLAHRGCRIGVLSVTPFNGHLFAPDRAPLAERAVVRDHVFRRVLEAMTTTSIGRGRRARIAFADLGVEQLGAIYERVLDHQIVLDGTERRRTTSSSSESSREGLSQPKRTARRARLVVGRGDRKATATFYTPRSLSDLIVRRTLGPLVAGSTSAEILRLRIVDPAMGSGAFLVAACRYLARAYEAALATEQQMRDHELDERDRAGFRRLIARRCLYGVDRNPMAVQLARLSLWLATLAADVPLTFLDHHLRVGDSLVGASLEDLLRQAPGRAMRRRAPPADALPLLASTSALDAMDAAIPARLELAETPDDTIGQVRHKERLLTSIHARGTPLSGWRRAADLWCAAWFWPEGNPILHGPLYGELLSATLNRGRSLQSDQIEPLLGDVMAIASRRHFFHWTFEFPEVFRADPQERRDPGFDAVIGNPPWDVLHGERGTPPPPGRQLTTFVRDAHIYVGSPDAHANLYLLFVERAVQLLREGGRLGLVLPWGLLADHGAGRTRRLLFDRCTLDACLAFDNRHALFPIHRSLRLLALTATRGAPSRAVPLTHVRGDASSLDGCSDQAHERRATSLLITRDFLDIVSPATLAVPDVRSPEQLRLLERLWSVAPELSSAIGWNVRFGRELNATDDRDLFRETRPGLLLLEGKHIEPFGVRTGGVRRFVVEDEARRRLPAAPFTRSRVGYRDVASATNRRTLIAALIPPGSITTHTIFCCRTQMGLRDQHALCALLNSFVANWLVRRWVSTHVTVALVERLHVPGPSQIGSNAAILSTLAETLASATSARTRMKAESRLQALAARVWGVTRDELLLILEDFPIVDEALKRGTVTAFDAVRRA
jgi:hypothetical protein